MLNEGETSWVAKTNNEAIIQKKKDWEAREGERGFRVNGGQMGGGIAKEGDDEGVREGRVKLGKKIIKGKRVVKKQKRLGGGNLGRQFNCRVQKGEGKFGRKGEPGNDTKGRPSIGEKKIQKKKGQGREGKGAKEGLTKHRG